ncbi:HPP family protein [Amycolatopsis sp. NPDC051903]|uniref:HPP family protein n=1 Tax=Amycolatopsis sp. NPDC051903 TaxID=3363936 RepID=UPI0037A4ED30
MQTRDIMTTPVIAVTPSTPLDDAADVMARGGFTTLPVVDPAGRLLGVVCELDLVRAGFPAPQQNTDADDEGTPHGPSTVATVMRAPDVTVPSDLDPAELTRRMAQAGVRALPVVDEGKLVGIVTFRDVLRALPEIAKS